MERIISLSEKTHPYLVKGNIASLFRMFMGKSVRILKTNKGGYIWIKKEILDRCQAFSEYRQNIDTG